VVEQCLTSDERIDVVDLEALGAESLAAYARLRDNADLLDLLASGEPFFEVPFSFVAPDRPGDCVRGVIDCLVLTHEGAVVVELKTGGPRPDHLTQVDLYRQAIGAFLGETAVEVRIFYPKP
jgi:hypothetical protein